MQITQEHWILKELHNLIWKENHWQMENYHYKHKGVPLQEFKSYLHKKYLWSAENNKLKRFWLFQVKVRLNKKYIGDFLAKNGNLIKDCMEKGYLIKQEPLTDNTDLTLTAKGKSFIEFFGFIQVILESFDRIFAILLGFIFGGLGLYFLKLLLYHFWKINLPS